MSGHPVGRVLGWILLALAGLALAVVLSVTASNLSTQPIGLSGEPLRAGQKLAPPAVTRDTTTTTPKHSKRTRTQTTPTTSTPSPTTPPATTTNAGSGSGSGGEADDHGGRRGGSDD